MTIIEVSSGIKHKIEIIPLEKHDFKRIKEDRYFFDWSIEKNQEIFKLQIIESSDILGLISIERIPKEWRIHIRLLTVSIENKGKAKIFDRIAGNLIAHAAKLAVSEYAELACVSLRPKSVIAHHYMNAYNMRLTGSTLSIEVPEILDLINQFDNE